MPAVLGEPAREAPRMAQAETTTRVSYGVGLVVLVGAALAAGAAGGFTLRALASDDAPKLASAAISADGGDESIGLAVAPARTEPPATTTTVPVEVTTTSTMMVEGEVRLYSLSGGTISVGYQDDGDIVVADADLADGYEMESTFVDGVLTVDLRDGERHSQLVAWCEANGPMVRLDDH